MLRPMHHPDDADAVARAQLEREEDERPVTLFLLGCAVIAVAVIAGFALGWILLR